VIAPAFGRVHPVFHTPSTAILFVGGVGIFGALIGRSALVPVLNVNATCFLFAYLLSCVGVIKLRRERPDTERPFRIPGGIILPVVASVACLILLIPVTFYQPYIASQGAFPIEWGFLMVWAFLGVLFWFLSRKVRGSISEEQRRDIMLGKGDPAL
jgi:amino acid transporter